MLNGIHRLALPLPFELNEVNAYLVKLRDGWMLVDTGLDNPKCQAALETQLAALGVRFEEIRQILLTHSHPDHIGGARRMLERTGAQLLMEEAEWRHLEILSAGSAWLKEPLVRAGVPDPLYGRLEASFDGIQFQRLTPDRVLSEGDEIETAIGPLRVATTPGHSSGHACLWHEPSRTLFSGDTVLETISPNIAWMPGRDMLGEYLTSLGRLDSVDAEWLLPGHYAPFRGHRQWIRDTAGHHEERCCLILGALGEGPRTAHQLVSAVWERPLAPFHHRLAVFEVLAHLEYLRRQERVRLEPQERVDSWHV